MTITIGRIRNHIAIAGQSQGFLGLPYRVGRTFDTGTKQEYPMMETAWLFEMDDIVKLMRGEPLILGILGVPPHPPLHMHVGDDE